MTRAEALAEARRRWGKRARVQAYPAEHGQARIRMVYESGNTTRGLPVVGGCGPDWAAAFADADRRAAERGSK